MITCREFSIGGRIIDYKSDETTLGEARVVRLKQIWVKLILSLSLLYVYLLLLTTYMFYFLLIHLKTNNRVQNFSVVSTEVSTDIKCQLS